MSERCLIVGGPHDGEWRDVETKREFLELPVKAWAELSVFDAVVGPDYKTPSTKRAVYRCHDWHMPGGIVRYIYAAPDLTSEQVFGRLLDGYKPEGLAEGPPSAKGASTNTARLY